MAGGIGGYRPGEHERGREDIGARRERLAQRMQLMVAGCIRQVHQIASSQDIKGQDQSKIVVLLQTLTENLESIPQDARQPLRQDIVKLAKASSDIPRDVVENLLGRLSSSTAQEAPTEEQEQIVPFEMIGEIASHMPTKEAFKMQRVSKAVARLPAVQQAREKLADSIARRAIISDTLRSEKPLSSLKDTLTEATRNSVRKLDLHTLAILRPDPLTPEMLRELRTLFPNTLSLNLSYIPLYKNLLVALSEWTSLRQLYLVHSHLVNDSIAYLSPLTQLEEVDVSENMDLDGTTFGQLPATVRKLDAHRCTLINESINNLSHLTRLEEVTLDENRLLDGSTFDHLPATVRRLYAYHCSLTNATIGDLSHLTNLETVELIGNPGLDRSALAYLPGSVDLAV